MVLARMPKTLQTTLVFPLALLILFKPAFSLVFLHSHDVKDAPADVVQSNAEVRRVYLGEG